MRSLVEMFFPCEKKICRSRERLKVALDALAETLDCDKQMKLTPIEIPVKGKKHGNHANPRQV